eukprot:gnl/TRDRNA2_/TRDRNA2_194987_c0_seq1.p1 gnl/TRDRNA2_/TRDRNA2_194987_c0~~gnl/TRDRNA2_/TRDRNA2_194987_c0_seq1.p1  ORF type:complete len:203 (+),score=18.02 gnl/TRDRNA2_/TRDRNA2_194987_c0_seq1:98-706(+)
MAYGLRLMTNMYVADGSGRDFHITGNKDLRNGKLVAGSIDIQYLPGHTKPKDRRNGPKPPNRARCEMLYRGGRSAEPVQRPQWETAHDATLVTSLGARASREVVGKWLDAERRRPLKAATVPPEPVALLTPPIADRSARFLTGEPSAWCTPEDLACHPSLRRSSSVPAGGEMHSSNRLKQEKPTLNLWPCPWAQRKIYLAPG